MSILPVNNDYHLDFSLELKEILEKNNIRVYVNSSDEKLSYRMREEQVKKIPIMVVIGDKEKDEHKVTLRLHGSEQKEMTVDDFVTNIIEAVKNKSKNI